MDQQHLDLLWQFQQEDMKADAIAQDIKRSPTRKKIERGREFIEEQQRIYRQMGVQMAAMIDRKDVIRDAVTRLEESLNTLLKRLEDNPPETLEETRTLMQEAARQQASIAEFEQEISVIVRETADSSQKQSAILKEAARVKAQYDKLKEQYNEEYVTQKAALDAQRAVANGKVGGIPQELLDRYAAIKKHISPPMARLVNDQCGGCNTSQPSALLTKIRNGTELIECETCGRLIIP